MYKEKKSKEKRKLQWQKRRAYEDFYARLKPKEGEKEWLGKKRERGKKCTIREGCE